MKKIKEIAMPSLAIILAVILAIGTSAFKSEKSFFATTMYYHGPATYSQGDVQNPSNWNTTSTPCQQGNVKACQVAVPNAIVSGSSFISTVSLQASATTPSVLQDVKNSGSSVDNTIKNRN
ncbi:DUF6520 family protein [Parafilimonas terrae]|uniref:Uncharacterized protein n=1 Tax=Parafilimonas terrae TaxID=1465490 RepID=A0A1I5XGD8_9BACT|nr:DUF6520 family protein [Parafilimonas terrae]SFQ31042.1 hypothetical protein SAMN05444277_108173 [Parafilimonas terrae]